MKTDLWIVFAQDSQGNICIADTYEAELDPLPELQIMLARIDPEVVNSRTFFAVRVTSTKRTVSLYKLATAPTLSQPIPHLVAPRSHCASCRNGMATSHTCQASQGRLP